ncbi:MAG TPA: hypothetical protein VFI98_06475 [Pseudolabrys sp.]|nr:hypothetical protein [Pseudolabrys sp.]
MALVGSTEAQIVSITGHSLNDVRSILHAHYLHRDPELARAAIYKLELWLCQARGRGENRNIVVKMTLKTVYRVQVPKGGKANRIKWLGN